MTSNNETKHLYRSETDKMFTGICGGIAEVYNVDPGLTRVVTFLLVFFTFPLGLIAYFGSALILPQESEVEDKNQTHLDEVDNEDDENSEGEKEE